MPINVFYLDDEEDLCEIFSDIFSSDDVKVTTFTDPKKIIETVKVNTPDMIFLDYRLPSTNGDEVAQKLTEGIPKYLITGEISVNTKYKFNKIFSKPYKNDEIMKVILDLKATK